ncbi:MAG: AAA family ATPase [Clostridia bacterium]|nr:AAA family ATPase [Clostridia bacterium]
MYIKSIHITAFAGKQNTDITLGNGLNIISGENESGKSTIAEFVRFALYGFARKSDRELYQPFLSPLCAGSVTFACEDGEYTVERSENGAKRQVRVSKDGVPVEMNCEPGEFLLGIPSSELYVSTVYVGQGGTALNGKSTAEAVENLLFTGDENVSAERALSRLDGLRKELMPQKNGNGAVRECEREINNLNSEKYQAAEEDRTISEHYRKLARYSDLIAGADERLERARDDEITWMIKKLRDEGEKLAEEGEKADLAREQLELFESKHSRNDRMPGKKDRDELFASYTNLGNETRDLYTANRRITEIRGELEKNELDIEARKKENQPKIADAYLKRTIAGVGAVVCFAAFVACLVVTVIGVTSSSRVAYLTGGGLALLSLITLAAAFMFMKHFGTRAMELEDVNDLRDERLHLEDELSTRIKLAESEKEEFREACATYKEKADKWGLNPCFAVRLFDAILDEYEKLRTESAETNSVYINHRSAYDMKIADPDTVRDDGREIDLPLNYDDGTFAKIRQECSGYVREMEKRSSEVRESLAGILSRHRSATEIEEKICELTPKLEGYKRKYDAVLTAIEGIRAAEDEMRQSVFPRLSESAGGYLSRITAARYGSVGVDNALGMTFTPDDGHGGRVVRDARYMSGGTADAAYVCLRLALAELISEKKLPVILDESLIRLDDGRMSDCLRMLSETGRQILVFSSSDRESRLAEISGTVAERVRI